MLAVAVSGSRSGTNEQAAKTMALAANSPAIRFNLIATPSPLGRLDGGQEPICTQPPSPNLRIRQIDVNTQHPTVVV